MPTLEGHWKHWRSRVQNTWQSPLQYMSVVVSCLPKASGSLIPAMDNLLWGWSEQGLEELGWSSPAQLFVALGLSPWPFQPKWV